jgi:uncharacterized coiled-coil protein SlyX
MTPTGERPVEELLREEVADMEEDHDKRMAELEDQIAHDKSVHEHIIAVLSEGRCDHEAINDGLEQTIRELQTRVAQLEDALRTNYVNRYGTTIATPYLLALGIELAGPGDA